MPIKMVVCALAALVAVLPAVAGAKPPKKTQTLLVTLAVVEDGALVECDPGIRLLIVGETYAVDCEAGIGAFKIVVAPGKYHFVLSNTNFGDIGFDRVVPKRPPWFLHTVEVEVVDGAVAITSSNTKV